ncbi:Alpha/beta hydrolase fold-3 domain protein [Parafrankia sp. EAN1pec]|uniref:alpha/beta hydrolase n=1 Tax=Parafrankia sp. (strain EAN1pec) TaxID=298653 RepID=UPI0000540F8C|nr:Alpha/beta hydrolase fold-3 domain protein [Frankia sp. EAN1pec]
MSADIAQPAMRVPEREIPVPPTVSPEGQAMLALGMVGPEPEWNGVELDAAGWKKLIAEREAAVIAMTGVGGAYVGAEVEEEDLGGFVVFKIRPDGVAVDDRRVYLDFHGGGFIQDGGQIACSRAVDEARRLGAAVWSVDYRMPPDHPFPAGVDDGVAAYRRLLEVRRPEEIVIGGSSAGGNLAAATILKARDGGLPLPAAAVLNTPCTDLTESSDSWWTNEGVDTVLRGGFKPAFELWAGGHDLRNPYISVVYADLTKGFPPTILTTGTRDRLLSDTVRFHRALLRAGMQAELHVWEAMGHAGFLGTSPEDAERAAEIRRFCAAHWAADAA